MNYFFYSRLRIKEIEAITLEKYIIPQVIVNKDGLPITCIKERIIERYFLR